MPIQADERAARILRLNTHRENIIFALANSDLSSEQRDVLQTQLSSIETELIELAGGITLN